MSFVTGHITEWLNREGPIPTTPITLEDITKFRVGPYANAIEDIKEKWCHVMLHLLPSVCSRYIKPDVRENLQVSAVATDSDEAFLLWLVRFNAKQWETENEKEKEDGADQTKKRKRKGPHMSKVYLRVFLEILRETMATRKETDGGKGWEDALILAATSERKSTSMAKGNTVFEDGIVGTGEVVVEEPLIILYCMV